MNEKRIGFIIAGAGALIPQELALAYHLMEEKKIKPCVFAGTSSGSLSSIFLNGVLQNEAGQGKLSWDVLKDVVFKLSNADIYKNPAILDPANEDDLKKIFGTISNMFSDGAIGKIIDGFKLLGELAGDKENIKEMVASIMNIWNNGYVFDTSPLKATLTKYVNGKDYLDYQTLSQCYVPTHISAVNNVNGETRRFYSKNTTDGQCNPVDVLLASTAIPVAFPSQKVGATPYVDGGTSTDDIPVEDLMHDGLYDEIYVIAPQSPGLISGYKHVMTENPLLSNLLFTLQVGHAAVTPFQLSRAMSLVKDKSKAFYYMPTLAKNYNMLDFTGSVLEEQFNQSLSWARNNSPRVIKDFLPQVDFALETAP